VFVATTFGVNQDFETLNRMSKIDCTVLRKSCFKRWFGPLTPGSMRGSIFALMQTALGAGILSLPYTFSKAGIIAGTFFLLLGAYVAYYTMVWLT
jgi:predicted lipid-binding transport protein (Tim44 family)